MQYIISITFLSFYITLYESLSEFFFLSMFTEYDYKLEIFELRKGEYMDG